MPLVEDKFDQERVDSLKRYLQREAGKNRKRDFEIIIDGFKVVSRTDDINEFDDYEQEIRKDSQNISFLIYDGPGTNRNTRYSFALKEESKLPDKPMNGIGSLGEIDQLIQQRMEEKEKDFQLTRTKEELEKTKEELEEALEYVKMLEESVTNLQSKRRMDNNSIGEVLNALIGSVIRNNTDKLPGGEMLAGLFMGGEVKQPAELPPETEPSNVTYTKKQETDGSDEMTKHRLDLIASLQQKLDEQQMVGLFTIIDHLTAKPEQITTVIDILKNK